MTVSVITDSSACIPPPLAEELGIVVIPIQVTIDGDARRADEISRTELMQALEDGADVTTAGPSPGDFLDAIEGADEGEGAVIVTLAASMSSTHQNATLAAQQAMAEVEVVDSGSAAGGHALVATAAARAAADGADRQQVAEVARDAAGRVRLVATVGSLEALARSGRVPSLAQRTGDALGVRPLFEFRDGEVHVLMPSLAEDRSVKRLVERCLDADPGGGAGLRASVLHAGRDDLADVIERQVRERTDPLELLLAEFDAAMIVHSGTDVVGLAWWWDPSGAA